MRRIRIIIIMIMIKMMLLTVIPIIRIITTVKMNKEVFSKFLIWKSCY